AVPSAAAVGAINRQSAGLLPEAPWVAIVGFEDNRASLAWQLQQLIGELSLDRTSGLEVRAGSTAEPLWQALTELRARPEGRFIFKANLLPHAVAGFLRRAPGLPPGPTPPAHPGCGLV